MLRRLLPIAIHASDKCHPVATWLLLPVATFKFVMGVNAVVMTRYIATGADGIPVDRYPPDAAAAVLAFFSLWGLGEALLAAIGLLAVFRYRALVPLAFALLAIEHGGRKALLATHVIARHVGGSALVGVTLNWLLVALLAAGLVISLFGRRVDME